MIALLLFQDLLAIIVLVMIESAGAEQPGAEALLRPLLTLPLLGALSWLSVRVVLLNLIKRFDRYHEYIFLLSIGWCLGMAELAIWMGLSAEIGAFIAGISIASSPIAQYIAISLKPLETSFSWSFSSRLGAASIWHSCRRWRSHRSSSRPACWHSNPRCSTCWCGESLTNPSSVGIWACDLGSAASSLF